MVHTCVIYWSYKINQVSVGASLKKIKQKYYPGILSVHGFVTPSRSFYVCWPDQSERRWREKRKMVRHTVPSSPSPCSSHHNPLVPYKGARVTKPTGFSQRRTFHVYELKSFILGNPSGPGKSGKLFTCV